MRKTHRYNLARKYLIFTLFLLSATLTLSIPSQGTILSAEDAKSRGTKGEQNKPYIKIVALGDSLTEGYGVAKESAFPALLENQLRDKGFRVKVTNAGISGSTTASGMNRLSWLLRGQPDILILALGANDALRGFKPEASEKNLRKTLDMAKKQDLRVVLAGMKAPINYGNEYREKFDAIFPLLAKEYDIPFVPFLLEGVAGEPKLNISDGIHPNEKGQKVIAKTLLKVLLPEIRKHQRSMIQPSDAPSPKDKHRVKKPNKHPRKDSL